MKEVALSECGQPETQISLLAAEQLILQGKIKLKWVGVEIKRTVQVESYTGVRLNPECVEYFWSVIPDLVYCRKSVITCNITGNAFQPYTVAFNIIWSLQVRSA